jgi:protein ImuA
MPSPYASLQLLTTPSLVRPRTRASVKSAASLLRTGMAQAGLHEIYAATQADGAAVTGFALANASRLLAGKSSAESRNAILWARHDFLQSETGSIYPPGLIEFGIAPAAVAVVQVRDVLGTLQAGLDAARCTRLAAVLVEFWGAPRAYDLTASRKLSLAAKASGVPLFVLRHAASILPSAAETRWRVRALPSRVLAANAPGRPAFEVTLLRHRGGKDGQHWRVEWNRDTACFEELGKKASISITGHLPYPSPPLSGDLAAFSPDRAAANDDGILRKTG